MPRKPRVDAQGAMMLTGMSLLFAFNAVLIKVTNDGLQPVFAAALRSIGGACLIYAVVRLRGLSPRLPKGTLRWGVAIGAAFAFEFTCLFVALDLTTVTRSSVIFYTMPIWLALAAHVLIPGERLTAIKTVGLLLAFGGVLVALLSRGETEAAGRLIGDLLALAAAMGWASIALIVRSTPLKDQVPEVQLFWQLAVSAPILLVLSSAFGPAMRGPEVIHWASLAFQVVAVVSAGFLVWFWLLKVYPAASVASFAFLAPVFGVALGWLLLGEPVGPAVLVALALVSAGLVLVNRPPAVKPAS